MAKLLGLSSLVIAALMALNASTAPANWQLKRNTVSVKTLNLVANQLQGEILFPELGVAINCTSANVEVGLSLIEGGAGLAGKYHALFKECTTLNPTCPNVHSPGFPNGTIIASGEGTATMSGEETFLLLEGAPISSFETLGTICLLHLGMTGSALLTFLESGKELVTHLAHLDEEELFHGEEQVLLDGSGGAESMLSHVTQIEGAKWAIGLTGL